MGIEKMSLLSVEGPIERLDAALMTCSESGVFQITDTGEQGGTLLSNLNEQNPYIDTYTKLRDISVNLGIPVEYTGYGDVPYETGEDFGEYCGEVSSRYTSLKEEYDETCAALEEHMRTDAYVRHLLGLNVSFADLFSMKYVKLRIGRLPADSEKKLAYYSSKCFIFIPFEKTPDYVWGIYLVPTSVAGFADMVMSSLYFERTKLPSYLEDNAEDADKKLAAIIEREREKKERLEKEIAYFTEELKGRLPSVMCKLKYKSDCFELRKKALICDGKFSFGGYCPARDCAGLAGELRRSGYIQTVEVPLDGRNASADVPVKLRNNPVTRPFEMFVKMYGLPVYGSFDPTPYVAYTYMLLFGIMFGDVGQGLLISLLGLIMTKTTKSGLAPIMTRIGLFSAAFGVVYGSVFGIETIITPFFHRENIWNGICSLFGGLGLPEHPENVFQAATVLLLFSLAIGIVLILISMVFNTVLKFRAKSYGEAVFSVNGVCGIVFYTSLVVAMVSTLLYGFNLFSPAYIIVLIVLPLLAIFFKTPLTNLITGTRSAEKVSIGSFIIENFIELFEAAISYLSNTMSYLRVGGFILSHAGFMLVVSQLAGTTDPNAPITVGTVVVYIIGNLVVMGIEGLLVGIQVLRLEFYEIFNRFYDANGKDFRPIEIKFDTEN